MNKIALTQGRDRHALKCKRLGEMREALKDCKTEIQRDKCRDAYYKLLRFEVDALQQSRGFDATEFYLPQLS